MKTVLLAAALWTLVAFLLATFAAWFIRAFRRRRQRPGKPFSASTGTYGGFGMDERANLDSPREITVLSFTRKEVRTMSGLQLLIERYVRQIKELETRMADAKHKLEIVMEASRLLAEEGLSDD
ncbi:MAG: hypothetical protein ABSH25_21750 [Syntrophorhabdales bacterium]|jgi:hypothetical protein